MVILEAAFKFSKSLFKMLFLALLCVLISDKVIYAQVTGCVKGALAYQNCTFNGVDVSAEITLLGWVCILLFSAWVCSGLLSLLLWPFRPLKESLNKSVNPSNDAPAD